MITDDKSLVLVADDLLIGSRVREGAKPSGFTVSVVSTEEAVRKAIATEPRPRAILVALTVRRLDPYALIRTLKTDFPDLPILAFAGHVERDCRP